MLVAYLLSTHKVGKTMNAYQLLRNALHFLGEYDMLSEQPGFFFPLSKIDYFCLTITVLCFRFCNVRSQD